MFLNLKTAANVLQSFHLTPHKWQFFHARADKTDETDEMNYEFHELNGLFESWHPRSLFYAGELNELK